MYTLDLRNDFFDLNLSYRELIEIALLVNPEVPYFLFGGYQMVLNNGAVVRNIERIYGENYLVAFSNLNINWNNIYDFNTSYLEINDLVRIKNILLESKAQLVNINGFGPSVVGIFDNHHDRFDAYVKLSKENIKSIKCKSFKGIITQHKYI